MFRKITDAVVRFLKEYLPSSYWLALILTLIVFLYAAIFTNTPLEKMFSITGKGMFRLLAFTMQMVLILITGYALAKAPIVVRFLKYLARLPKNATQAIIFTAFIAHFPEDERYRYLSFFSSGGTYSPKEHFHPDSIYRSTVFPEVLLCR